MTTSQSIHPEAADSSSLQQLDGLIRRDRRRKILLLMPLAGLIVLALAFQSSWLLAVLTAGLVGAQAVRHRG